jgi:hypothetical protein
MRSSRRSLLWTLACAATGMPAIGKEISMFKSLLEASQQEKRGVVLYVKGQQIAGAVLRIDAETVEMRNREYSRIVVRLDSIDAAAMS